MKSKFIIISLLVICFSLSLITIGYSAYNANFTISGDAIVRANTELRINDIKIKEKSNGAYEKYNSNFSKNTTDMYVVLPSSTSSITYEITITNQTNTYFSINEITELVNSNPKVSYKISGLKEYSVYQGNTYTFTITFSTKGTNQETALSLSYDLKPVTQTVWDFDYTNSEQTFNVPYKGRYKLEVWGSQGGNSYSYHENYGGYSVGTIGLDKDQMLYVNVGGMGSKCESSSCENTGGYNGGGFATYDGQKVDGGGGATHIATKSGLLSTLSGSRDDILIVAGGGGGLGANGRGGAGGGFTGGSGTDGGVYGSSYSGTGGTQVGGGRTYWAGGSNSNAFASFGRGGQYSGIVEGGGQSGGGGGYYGGGASSRGHGGAGGGSGYIGNPLLMDKSMYGYNVEESFDYSSKTISTTNYSSSAVSMYAKSGAGHARITLDSTYNDTEEENALIKISDIKLLSVEGGASESSESIYSTDSTSMYLNLPNSNSVATYLVTITNSTESYFSLSSISELKNTNSDVSYSIENIKVDNVYQGNTYQFKVIVRTSATALNTILSLKYVLKMVNTPITTFSFLGSEQYYITPYNAKYKFELWGSSGARKGLADSAGRGAYTSGYLDLEKGKKLYVYVGGNTSFYDSSAGFDKVLAGSYNGGGAGESTGGGSTDIRLVNGEWNNFESLKSRIMVAGGGGGAAYTNTTLVQRGDAGGINGYDAKFELYSSTDYSGHGGSQTSGGKPGSKFEGPFESKELPEMSGYFGRGGFGYYASTSSFLASGGGGGYYGGGHGIHPGSSWGGGGGGSSFISGYTGCNAISESSTETNIIHTGSPNHYSGYVFENSVMIAGNSSMPSRVGNGSMVGNTEVGYAKITLIPKN